MSESHQETAGPVRPLKEKDPDFDIDKWEPDEPLWMTNVPEDPTGNPALMALHDLTYNDLTPNEIASQFKTQGNDFFKHSRPSVRHAGHWYTRAIETEGVTDFELLSQCYSNRAACLLTLGNYGRCIDDCDKAVEYQPSNIKAYFRGAKAALELDRFEKALEFCNKGLEVESDNKSLSGLKQKALIRAEVHKGRELSKVQAEAAKAQKEVDRREVIKKHKIRLGDSLLKDMVQLVDGSYFFEDDAGVLNLPVLIVYEEFHQTDFIQSANLNMTISETLDMVIPPGEYLAWDENRTYGRDNVAAYTVFNQVPPFEGTFASGDAGRTRKVKLQPTTNLDKVVHHPDYIMPGAVVIYVVSNRFRETFLKIPVSSLGTTH